MVALDKRCIVGLVPGACHCKDTTGGKVVPQGINDGAAVGIDAGRVWVVVFKGGCRCPEFGDRGDRDQDRPKA